MSANVIRLLFCGWVPLSEDANDGLLAQHREKVTEYLTGARNATESLVIGTATECYIVLQVDRIAAANSWNNIPDLKERLSQNEILSGCPDFLLEPKVYVCTCHRPGQEKLVANGAENKEDGCESPSQWSITSGMPVTTGWEKSSFHFYLDNGDLVLGGMISLNSISKVSTKSDEVALELQVIVRPKYVTRSSSASDDVMTSLMSPLMELTRGNRLARPVGVVVATEGAYNQKRVARLREILQYVPRSARQRRETKMLDIEGTGPGRALSAGVLGVAKITARFPLQISAIYVTHCANQALLRLQVTNCIPGKLVLQGLMCHNTNAWICETSLPVVLGPTECGSLVVSCPLCGIHDGIAITVACQIMGNSFYLLHVKK